MDNIAFNLFGSARQVGALYQLPIDKERLYQDRVKPSTKWTQNSSRIDRKKVDNTRNNRRLGSAFEIHVKCEIHFHQLPNILDCPR